MQSPILEELFLRVISQTHSCLQGADLEKPPPDSKMITAHRPLRIALLELSLSAQPFSRLTGNKHAHHTMEVLPPASSGTGQM